jgi:hypothetical protein
MIGYIVARGGYIARWVTIWAMGLLSELLLLDRNGPSAGNALVDSMPS